MPRSATGHRHRRWSLRHPGQPHQPPRSWPYDQSCTNIQPGPPSGGRPGGAVKVRRFGEFRYAAKTWNVERRVIARVEATDRGADSRFVVTNLAGTPRWLYEAVYCAL